ncbi:MAG: DUF4405 domain-containing protein [Hyphomicrobiaceae bacterium]|nr:DUF4405 domain-containing protein [Hyphomicrobiaceae bacterium]
MRDFINRYATPLTTGLFIVSTISGVALFFHFQSGLFHGMHEWLSMVLIVPFVLHVYKNWLPLTIYFKRNYMTLPLAVSLVAAIAFVAPSLMATGTGGGGDPLRVTMQAVQAARIDDAARLYGADPAAILTKLKSNGFDTRGSDETLTALASRSGKSTREALFLLAAEYRPAK